MNIVYTPNPVLLAKAKPVGKISAEIVSLIDKMEMVLRYSDIGVGLAAPQVGKSLRIFLVSPHLPDKEHKEGEKITVFINPQILSKSLVKRARTKKDKRKLEGCLSIPDVWGPVARSSRISLKYLDEKGNPHQEEFRGFLATIIQHEMDHLNGILFTQRVLEQRGKLYREIAEEKRFEEIEI
ncbi:MAG: peptide deformylase [Candidatus Roizmanbacteria bacterium]|nr:peptide deformylase [Candidatus Roizmanbacteria bacterium]